MRKAIIILIMSISVAVAHGQRIAGGTNVALLATQTYNGEVEMTVGRRSTVGLTVFGNHHPYLSKEMKVLGFQPEYRYYLSGRPMHHHFVGVGALAVNYDFVRHDKQHKGHAGGAALTFGYALPLTRRLNLTAYTSAGLLAFKEKGDDWGVLLAPTKIGLSVSYIFR